MPRVLRLLVIAVVGFALLAPAAQAGIVRVSGSTLTFSGGNAANDVTVDRSSGTVRIHDNAGGLTAGNGCTSAGLADAVCLDASVNTVQINGEGGDDHLTVNTAARIAGGDGNDTIVGSAEADEITGGNGNDNLTGGSGPDRINGDGGNDTLDGGSEDDVLRGGDGDDSITGGSEADRLEGGAGDDALDGGVGPDSFDGGTGNDTADYSLRVNPVFVDLDGNPDDGEVDEGDNVGNNVETVIGGASDDRLTAISSSPKTLIGGAGNDSLNGGKGKDSLQGGEGDDTLNPGVSDDQLEGGPGIDTADFSTQFNAVTVNLTTGATRIVRGHVGPRRTIEKDGLREIENVIGSSRGDTLIGDANANALQGGPGPDTLVGGGGPDLLSGGAGRDVATYASRTSRVNVTLDDQPNDGSAGEGDNVTSSTEGVVGGSGRDSLTGNNRPNDLVGGGGNDLLVGLAGNDYLAGGTGNDRVDAGLGSDRVAVRDGQVDQVRCGAGPDAVDADKVDKLNGCESKRAVTATKTAPAQ